MTMRALSLRLSLVVAFTAATVACERTPRGEQAAMSEDSVDHGSRSEAVPQDTPVPLMEEPFQDGQERPSGMLQDLDTIRGDAALDAARPVPLPDEPRAVTDTVPR